MNILKIYADRAALGALFPKWKGQYFWESDQCLFSFIQKETDWQSICFVKMAGTLFSSTIDPLLIKMKRGTVQRSYALSLIFCRRFVQQSEKEKLIKYADLIQ